MSRIGNKIIEIPSNVTVEKDGSTITVNGPNGESSREFNPVIDIQVADKAIPFTRPHDHKEVRAIHGTTRALVINMVVGVSEGFEKKLEMTGVGYRAQLARNKLT